jgi:protein-tyrosine kinase
VLEHGLGRLLKRKEPNTNGVDKSADSGAVERRGASISPVLKTSGARSTISDGFVVLAGGEILDLEATERFRILRAQIERLSLSGQQYQIIAVTSAVPGEGKSIVAANLARAFGIDPRGKALLIDCDLRKSSGHRFFSQSHSPGLSDVLITGKSLKSVLRSVEPGLDMITSGSPVVDSTRTLEQPGLALMLEELKKHYRYIILDCPPVLFCPEPLFLTQLASGTLLVARAWRTQKKLVGEAVNVIGKGRILGLVINECTDALKQYGYYGYYGYDKESIARAKLRMAKRAQKRGWFSRQAS